jgi:S1-C subfamily serine protease
VGLTTTASSPAGFDAQAGYAIPMDRMGRRAVEVLKQGKEVEYGLLGIQADPQFSNRVFKVNPNSPAARGLLQINDEVLAVGGVPVSNFDSLILAVGAYSPGDLVRLKIRRSDEVIDRTIVLAKYPIEGEVIATNRSEPWRGLRVDYSTAIRAQAFGFPDLESTSAGVVVTDVEEGSPAAVAGLKKGVVILRVGERPVQSPRMFAEAVDGQEGPVTLETEMGALTVGTAESPRPKSTDSPHRGR